MKTRRAKGSTTSKSSTQLDLFSRPATPSITPAATQVVQDDVPTPRVPVVANLGRAPTDQLLEYVLGRKGPGRPEKVMKEDASEPAERQRLLDVREAAERLGLSKSTLDKMRCSGRGPRFIRASDRAIRYDPKDLQAFADERRRRSTSEMAGLVAT